MKPRIYVYKITFLESDEFYIGVHKEKRYDEFYMGSPVTHKNFWISHTPKKEILKEFEFSDDGWKQAILLERELISFSLNDPLCLNENCGGMISLRVCSETASRVNKKRWKDPEYRAKRKVQISSELIERWKDPEYRKIKSLQRSGEKHPLFGTIWITDGTKEGSKRVLRGEDLPEGYRLGRVCK